LRHRRFGQVVVVLALVALAPGARADGVDPDALYARARELDTERFAPADALVLYDRIAREFPDARVAVAAKRRAHQQHALVGAHGEHARETNELARLVGGASSIAPTELVAAADALADAAWPGAPDAATWIAAWLRERGELADARARFERVAARWPDSPRAIEALRGAAGCAIDAGDWSDAEAIAARLPATNADDRASRDDLLAAAARGRARVRLAIAAWIALVAAFVVLAGSLVEAIARAPRGRVIAALRPPIEIVFVAPVAALLVALSFTAHRAIAPAVTRISIVGVALAWLSGAALDTVRSRGRPVRLRAIVHVVACAIGVVAVGYLAMTRDGLYDQLVETVRFGPES
jgi:hypothetical protein